MSQRQPTRIWMVRHGQTDWNLQRRIQGHTPTELNATGRAQAVFLANWLSAQSFSAIWSSDLPRARQTAEIIGERLNLPVHTTTKLRERNLGAFEGKTWEEIRTIRAGSGGSPLEFGDLADWTGVPGVETDGDLWARAAAVIDELCADDAGTNILAVTHGGVIKHVIWHVLGLAAGTPRRFPLSNGLIAIIEPRKEGRYLAGLFDAGMLAGQSPEDTASAPSV